MANTARKGNQKELRSAELFAKEGWVVGSRRHVAGPGDLLLVKFSAPRTAFGSPHGGEGRAMLVEVKARIDVWQGFRRHDRAEMLDYCERFGLEPMLAWWRPRARTHELLGPERWPA